MSEINELIYKLQNKRKEPSYPKRIKSLKSQGMQTEIIEEGVAKVAETISRGIKSFVIYGEPQSGKTEVMIALACKIVDLGFETIFVVMNDNTELENQNYQRFIEANELNPSPMRDYQLFNLENSQLKQKKTRIIFCRKNSKNYRN